MSENDFIDLDEPVDFSKDRDVLGQEKHEIEDLEPNKSRTKQPRDKQTPLKQSFVEKWNDMPLLIVISLIMPVLFFKLIYIGTKTGENGLLLAPIEFLSVFGTVILIIVYFNSLKKRSAFKSQMRFLFSCFIMNLLLVIFIATALK